MNETVRVLVTGVSGGSIGEQVCKTLRSGQKQYEIFAANTSLSAMLAVHAEHYEVLPGASSPQYIGALTGLVTRRNIQFLVPGSEPELVRISGERAEIERSGVRILVNAHDAIRTCVDKCATFRFLADHGFTVPATLEIGSPAEAAGLDAFPYILKPAKGGGSASTFLAQDRTELEFFAAYLLKYGQRCVIQEYVGTPQEEYTVGVLHYPDSTLCGTVVLRRSILDGLSNRLKLPNRTGREELGTILAVSSGISQGSIVSSEPIRRTCEVIAGALGSTGPMNIQGRWFRGRFMPFEINPRFSGTSPMRALAGFNEPELLVEWHSGLRRGVPPEARFGVVSRGLVEYFAGQSSPAAGESS